MKPNQSFNPVINDPVLEKIIAAIPKPEIQSTGDVFHDLMSCVLEQQIHYRSSKKIFQKMMNKAGLIRLSPDNFYLLEQKSFADLKLSAAKYETIQAILNFWQQNEIDWNQLDDKDIIEKLSSIKGVGKWTIDMILLYTLNRPNIFPYDDFHLKQIMVHLYGLDATSKLKAQKVDVAIHWGEQKSLAVLYLLAWKEQSKQAGDKNFLSV